MSLSVGVDIIELDRVQRAVERYDQRFLARIYTPQELEYVRHGEHGRVALADGICDDPQLREPNSWIEEKLLIFRPVPMAEPQICFH